MATAADVEAIPLSGRHYVDALLDKGPAWNYLTRAENNTLFYSFAAVPADFDVSEYIKGPAHIFSAVQQQNVRHALAYVTEVTGIRFLETPDINSADIALWRGDLLEEDTIGLCAWAYDYSLNADQTIAEYSAAAVIFLDDADFVEETADVQPGSYGYQTLLHELGHMLGLKHTFEGDITLTGREDSKAYTLMSYQWTDEIYSSYQEFDLAALKWIYGGDGLAGKYGINSSAGGRYLAGTLANDVLVGTAAADLLEGSAGDDRLDGGAGQDTAVYGDARASHVISQTADGYRLSSLNGTLGTDELSNIERLAFADTSVALDINGIGGQAYRMYQAALGRTPDAAGLGYWIAMMDQGLSLRDVAANFMRSAEFIGKFGGSNPEEAVFVNKVYNNVLHRTPDDGGFKYFMDALAAGNSKIDMLVAFSESPENKAQLIGSIGNGIDFHPYI